MVNIDSNNNFLSTANISLPGRIIPLKQLRRKPDRRVMGIIADNWIKVRMRLFENINPVVCYSGYTLDDIIAEAFEYAIRDDETKTMTDTEVVEWFTYRFKLIQFKVIHNSRVEKKILYGRGEDVN